jgi:hypothetical protein
MGLIIKPGNLVDHEHLGVVRVVLRGDLDLASSMNHLQGDWYQRKDGFSTSKLRKMINQLMAGAEFPDIILGMRGHKYDVLKGDAVLLHDPVYIIDGLQRWSAAMQALRENPKTHIRLGAKMYFDTDVEFERTMFRELNTTQTAMSANVILRNEKDANRLAGSFYNLANSNSNFAAYRRVCWDQTPSRGEGGDLITGMMLLNLTIEVHRHLIGTIGTNYVLDRLRLTEQKIDTVGLMQNRANLIAFFDFIDNIWGVRTPGLIRTKAPWLQGGWLLTIAKVLSDHEEFWHEKELFISLPMAREFKKIDPLDPENRRLSGGNQNGRILLYQMMINQLNKGRSTRRLVDRYMKARAKEAASK